MKIFYDEIGTIFYAVPSKDIFWFTHSTNIPLLELTVDELDPLNKLLCLDLMRTVNKTDINGQGKYHILNGQLYEREGWLEYTPEGF